MKENDVSLFVVPCSGVNNDLETPVNVSVAYDIGRTGISIGCPFAKEIFDEDNSLTTRCTAPKPEGKVSERSALTLPECYHLNRKTG